MDFFSFSSGSPKKVIEKTPLSGAFWGVKVSQTASQYQVSNKKGASGGPAQLQIILKALSSIQSTEGWREGRKGV